MKIIRFIFYPYIWLYKRLLFSALEFILVLAGWKTLDEALKEYEYLINKKDNFLDVYIECMYRNMKSTKDYFDQVNGRVKKLNNDVVIDDS